MRIGIDLGGTKIEAIALDDDGTILRRERADTPRGSYEGTLAVIGSLVESLERRLGRSGTVGIGIPGAVSRATGRIKNANSVWLIGQPLATDVAARLGRPVRLANDANCFALSEACDGAAAGARMVFGVIIGTGTGAGLVVDGEVWTGANDIAGEWGHNPMPWPEPGEWPGPRCYCGRTGCIETFLSGPGLARAFEEATGRAFDPREIVRRAAAGDGEASSALERYSSRMARALAHVVNILDPEVIVLGGGMSNIDVLYERVPELWRPFVFSDRVDTKLVRARHGDSSGVRGAAWLWPKSGEPAGSRV